MLLISVVEDTVEGCEHHFVDLSYSVSTAHYC